MTVDMQEFVSGFFEETDEQLASIEQGLLQLEGEPRSLQIGSKSTRCPSISISAEEWPNHVARSPDAGGDA